jgi:hypothetical protein
MELPIDIVISHLTDEEIDALADEVLLREREDKFLASLEAALTHTVNTYSI